MKRAHGCGPAGEEGAGQEVVPATAPGLGGFPRKTREEKKLKEKKKQGGMKQGGGKELPQEQEQLVGVGTCRGREKKRDAEAPTGQEKEEAGQWRWYVPPVLSPPLKARDILAALRLWAPVGRGVYPQGQPGHPQGPVGEV